MSNKKERFQLGFSQKVVFYNPEEKKFLLLKDGSVDSECSKTYGAWELPGGHLEKGEDPTDALKREIVEEVGEEVKYELKESFGGYPLLLKEASRVNFFYLALYRGGEIKLSDEHTDLRWESLEKVEENKEYHEWLKYAVRKAAERIECETYLEDLKRAQADFENYKKRQAESQKELGGYLIEKLVLDIIPVLDNFRAATMHVPPEQKDSPWVVGIQYIEKQLEDVVKQNGVEVIEAKEGDVFDPSIHEAVSQENEPSSAEATDGQGKKEAEKHVIAKVLQNGFRLGGKVIRPAKVSVK